MNKNMIFIEKALKKMQIKENRINNTILFSFIFIIFCIISSNFYTIEGLPAFLLVLMMVISYIIFKDKRIIPVRKRRKYSENMKYFYSISNEISVELKDSTTIKIDDKVHNFILLITKTWFVFIDKDVFEIRRTDDIDVITDSLNTTHSYISTVIKFKDNTYLNRRWLELEDIEEKIKENYPNIKIGHNLLEDL